MPELVKAVIVDDEKAARDILFNLLDEIPGVEVLGVASNVQEGLEQTLEYSPDLLFLDIEMPVHDGFELVNKLKLNKIACDIIFVTAYNQYAVQAIKYAAFDYLVKPVDRGELMMAIERYRSERINANVTDKIDNLLHHLEEKKKIRLNTRTGYVLVNPEHVLYCEADSNYTCIYFKNGDTECSTMNLGKIEVLLPDKFLRISRFHLVNSDSLFKVDRKRHCCLLLNGNEKIELKIPVRKFKFLESIFST